MSSGMAVPVSRLRSQEFSGVVLQYMTGRKCPGIILIRFLLSYGS